MLDELVRDRKALHLCAVAVVAQVLRDGAAQGNMWSLSEGA